MARYQNLIEMQLTKRKEYRLYNDEIPRRLEEKMLIEQERLENGLGSISAWIEIKQKLVEQTGKALDVRFALKQIDLELKWIHIEGMTE